MKAAIVTLTALLALLTGAPAALAGDGVDGPVEGPVAVLSPGAVQFDGEAVFVSVRCANPDAPCGGSVAVASPAAPLVLLGGPAQFAIEAESGERVRVPLTPAGVAAAAIAPELQVVLTTSAGEVRANRPVERAAGPEGIVEGQTQVEPRMPAFTERRCARFGRHGDIRATGSSCVRARSLIAAVTRKAACRARTCTVERFRCTVRGSRHDCRKDARRVRWTTRRA